MTLPNIWDEHYFLLEPSTLPENLAEPLAPGASHPNDEMRPDRCGSSVSLGTIQECSQAFEESGSPLTLQDHESQICQDYQGTHNNHQHQAGAKAFLAYLEEQHTSLAEVTKQDLQLWALTPASKGKAKWCLPSEPAFQDARGLCVYAAEIGYIDAARGKDLAECSRQQIDVNSLRIDLQNPLLNQEEREANIRLYYQRTEKNLDRLIGVKEFQAYLKSRKLPLAEVTADDLYKWSLRLFGKFQGSMPDRQVFEGAKAFCAVAAELGHINEQTAQNIAQCSPAQLSVEDLRLKVQHPELTAKEREFHIRMTYHSLCRESKRRSGANSFVAYLEAKGNSLAEVTARDLEEWSLIPGASSKALPTAQLVKGAKGLCALAAEVEYIDVQRAKDIAEWKCAQSVVDALRMVLQNPAMTRHEREACIGLHYQNVEKKQNRQLGAIAFLAYLEAEGIPLAEVSTSDLGQWALTPLDKGRAKRNLPSTYAFEGAQRLCVLAAEVGHIERHRPTYFAEYARPRFDLEFLREVLQNSALTPKERDEQIYLNYQSLEKDPKRQSGASGLLAYLERHGRLFAEVTTNDLEQWARTPLPKGPGKGRVPDLTIFQGAQALCALAADVGYIDALSAQDIALCRRPQGDVGSLRIVLADPALTPQERDYRILRHYLNADDNRNRKSGASAFQAYLERQHKSLATVSTSDLEKWALTASTTGRTIGNLPSVEAFNGAKGLCALAAEVGYLGSQIAQALAQCLRPCVDVESLRTILQNPQTTRIECEQHISLTYQSLEKNHRSAAGAKGFMAYLEDQGRSLAEVAKCDLEEWALTPTTAHRSQSALPILAAFNGAKGLCALAGEVGYIDPQKAEAIAQCARPSFDVEFLRSVLQNPGLTRKECEYQIRLNYQSTEQHIHRQAGATGIMAYLASQARSLADVTKSDLEQWALTPIVKGPGKGTFPSEQAFDGAKGLCARAAEVGYINPQTAQELAQCPRPRLDVEFLRNVLENPALTPKTREYRIRQIYQSVELNHHRQAGASGILAYLASQGRTLAEVTPSDLEQWSVTLIGTGMGKGKVPSARAFEGAKALCALAAEVGYLDPDRALGLAQCMRPRSTEHSGERVAPSAAGKRTATSSSARREALNKRLRTDAHGASTSLPVSVALPQSAGFHRELALSPPSFADPNQHAASSRARSIQSLSYELESLENLNNSSGHFEQ